MPLHELFGHTGKINAIIFNTFKNQFISSSDDKSARVWNFVTGECVFILSGHTDYVKYADFSNNGLLIATASKDNTIIIWDA